ncbi:MAG: phospholipase D family protein [Gemmatimonadota bacterium]|nr:phospholipase D family protein [Gemmatimonadota bacterium]
MAEFLTTHGTAFQIENVIAGAKKQLTLVSPFLKLSKTLAERLQDAARRGASITIVFGKEELEREQGLQIAGLAGARHYFLPNLHAKCYFNEDRMVIRSMNMYEFSEKHNREMGVLLEAGEPAYTDALREVDSIIAASEERSVAPAATPRRRIDSPIESVAATVTVRRSSRAHRRSSGVCIRCQASIPRDPECPLCGACYEVWSAYQNADHQEQWCHFCGRPEETSVNRPLCRNCYSSVSS